MISLPTEIINKINDFCVGDTAYHKKKFINVVNQLNNVSFYCKTCWSNKDCDLCYDNHTEFTFELPYDDALKTYLYDFVGRTIDSCSCFINSRKLSFVNQNRYYNELEYPNFGLDSDLDSDLDSYLDSDLDSDVSDI